LRNGNFLRFFLAQFVSSLGDWVGVVAIAILAVDIGNGPAAVGSVMIARVLPGFIVGPLAGVLVDRWDRKRTMVTADLMRAVLIFSLPFFPSLLYLLVASVILESLTLIWGPAKDAALPHFVKRSELTHANSLSLMAVYGPWPLASIVFALLATLASFLATTVAPLEGLRGNTEALALWIDSLTFGFSALMVSTLSIPSSVRRAERLDLSVVKRDLAEGLGFVVTHKRVRPWMLGIALTFTAAGAVFSLGVVFVEEVLNASQDRGFPFLVGFLGTGMIIGLLAVGILVKRIQKDVLFSSSILLLGAGLIALASVNSLDTAIPIASALGFFGGTAYSTGYSLMHENTEDALRGRTFGAAYTIIRIGTLLGLGVFPFVAEAIGNHEIGSYEIPGTRATLWAAGLVAIGGGFLSMRAIRARGLTAARKVTHERGYFIAFEGGEGAGKSTQMEALIGWFEARGEEAVTTREPGGTPIGDRIREILLDPDREIDARTEALLYAADRAEHVAKVIKPALDAGKIVVSDRFIDSSLAYQGLARGLGLEEIYDISEWATRGILPDLVLYLKLDAGTGLRRSEGSPDRIEREHGDFHERVAGAYLELAERFPERFVVIDGGRAPAGVHQDIVKAIEERWSGEVVPFLGADAASRAKQVPR
jgi:dTMP kinase